MNVRRGFEALSRRPREAWKTERLHMKGRQSKAPKIEFGGNQDPGKLLAARALNAARRDHLTGDLYDARSHAELRSAGHVETMRLISRPRQSTDHKTRIQLSISVSIQLSFAAPVVCGKRGKTPQAPSNDRLLCPQPLILHR